jgi:hypothetical protein
MELSELDRTRQINEVATLIYQDFIVGDPTFLFAIHYLALSSERSGLLKHLRSAGRERALCGICDASLCNSNCSSTLLWEWNVYFGIPGQ